LQLFVHPRHWWQKVWRLRDRTIEFDLLVENAASVNGLALPQSFPTGAVNLKARRRWLFWLLLLSTATTALLGLLALAWHLFVWRPSLAPKIANFSTTQESYQEGKPDPIAFSWEITNPEKVGQVVLTQDNLHILELSRLLAESENIFAPTPMLKDKAGCSLETTISKNSPLTVLLRIYRRARKLDPNPVYLKCRTVIPADFLTEDSALSEDERTAIETLRKPVEGSYEFKLQVHMKGKNKKSDSAVDTTDTPDGEVDSKGVLFQTKQILGIGEPNKQQLADKQILENVVVTAPEPPEILQFESTQSEYRTVSQLTVLATTSKINTDVPRTQATVLSINPETDTTFDTPLSEGDSELLDPEIANADPQVIPIKLNWQITNPWDIKELRLTSLSPDGAENTEAITYFVREIDDLEKTGYLDKSNDLGEPDNKLILLDNGLNLLDSEEGFCEIIPASSDTGGADILDCKNVPTKATQVGDYVFYLTVVTRDGTEETPILQTTPTISVKPPVPAIVDFTVNGESVETKPRHVYVLNQARGKIDVTLNWDVKYAKEIELLPAPGKVIGNEITYTLSAAPGAETITLRGVNELEEEVTQSVIIEKVGFVSDAQQIPIQSSRRSTQAEEFSEEGLPALPPPPTVLPVPEIAPIRTPPRAN
ncbi:MAG: hypothetical protein AAGA83_22870, partial [Cyanobacteria bacterium P01_F01_bin.116]